MLKWLAVLGLVLGLAQAPINAPRQGRDQQNHPYRNADKGNSAAPTIAQPDIEPGAIVEKAEGKPKDDPPEQKSNYWKEAFAPANVPSWALVLVGVLAGYLAWRTLNAIKRQADLMEDTAKKQLRAYICLSESAVKFTTDGKLEAQMFFRNGGQTPAYDVRSWCHPLVDNWPLGYRFESPPQEMPRAVGVIPSQEKQIMVAPPLTLPIQIIERLSDRDFAFYVFGEVSYKDIFKKRHILSYRLVFGGPAGTRANKDSNGVTLGLLCMDVEGNEERDEPDEECPN